MFTLGVDDAGRGPIIGPMILAGVLVDATQEKNLKKHEVRDSKTVLQSSRVKLAELIKKNSHAHYIVTTQADEIDFSLDSGINLNTLEAIKTARVINEINKRFLNKKIKVIVDCPSSNVFAWRKTLLSYIKNLDNLEIHCEHKADANHISAAAASILAKCTREEEVEKLKQQFGDIGSGYPSDPKTKLFLKTHGKEYENSNIFRKSWATWKKIYPEKKQSTLSGF